MELTLLLIGVLLLSAALDAILRHIGPPVTFEDGAQAPSRAWRPGQRHAAHSPVRWLYHRRNLLIAPPLAFAAFSCFDVTRADLLLWPIGTALVVLGMTLRVWAKLHLHRPWGTQKRLVTTGPYSIVRHPLYAANIVICMGAVVVSELLWLLPFALAWCLAVYSLVVAHEERRLLRKHGYRYARYMAAVPRWVPRSVVIVPGVSAAESLRGVLMVELPYLLILMPFALKALLLR